MATLTLSKDFFRGELRLYGNWESALGREMLQNSIDAGASMVEVTFGVEDGHGVAVFTDDGCGMSRSIVEDVFFAVGKTTKTDADAVGGFGRARVITCFAQHNYEFRTQDLLVRGEGATYSISEGHPWIQGCEFRIVLAEPTADRIRSELLEFLRTCHLSTVEVVVDGERVEQTPHPTRASRLLRDEDGKVWARAYLCGHGYGRVNVGVRGLTMFHRWASTNDQVLIDLVPARAREVLAASRDTLRSPYADALDTFLADLANNRARALRPETTQMVLRVPGGGVLSTRTPAERSFSRAQLAVRADSNDAVAVAYRSTLPSTAAMEPLTTSPMGTPEDQGVSPLGFDLFMCSSATDTRSKRLARNWGPEALAVSRRKMATLRAWQAVVGHSLGLLGDAGLLTDEIRWTVGWVFDPDTLGQHRIVDGTHVLLMNPVCSEKETLRLHLSRKEDRRKLLATALHEAAHVVCQGHDEAFSSVLTKLVALFDQAEGDRLIRTAVAAEAA